MAYLHFRGGPSDGWTPQVSLKDDVKYVWLRNAVSDTSDRYHRTKEHVYIKGVRCVIFEYDPE